MNELRAIALMVLGVSAFSVMDGIGKVLSSDHDVLQIVWARYAFAVPPLMLIAAPRRWPAMLGRRVGLQLARGLLPVLGGVFIVLALRTVPLADATAITFVAPLLVTALSIPLLGETVGWHRWVAVVVGFAGVVVIARPGAGAFQWAALLPLATALAFALYQILTKVLSAGTDPRGTLVFTMLTGLVLGTAALPFVWQTPTPAAWGLMALSGLANAFGHYALIRSYEGVPASTLAPFIYAQIIGAALFGFAVLGDVPDAFTLLGTAIIVASGLYVVHRERQRARTGAAPQPSPASMRSISRRKAS
ncbi:MAG: DMT family transporter [Rhodospirillaceae bacterium]|nr:DMT family transporter [Rhodospirillaceae bacterium]